MPKWTTDQQKVIDTRDNNILVSAAAGSGKTAVLVERIIGKIINDNVEVDNLLVVTFTNAAAKEMKERIRRALDKEISNDPSNEFLVRQNTLITNANISTIDSFCGRLVRENFNDIGIDPSFRICDESEESLLLNEAIDIVMDSNFATEDNDGFIELVKLYSKTSDYSAINEIIIGLIKRASAYPWPKEWLEDISRPYMVEDINDINDISWVREMHQYYINELTAIKEELCSFYDLISPHFVNDNKGKNKAKTLIESGISYIDTFLDSDSLIMLYKKVLDAKKMSLSEKGFKSSFDFDLESQAAIDCFNEYSSICKLYNDLYIELSKNKTEDIIEECQYVSRYALKLISLTSQTIDAFDEIKRDNSAYTFNDIERFALDILIDPVTKEITDTGLEMKSLFNEVMVDEYQDINDLQEMILTTLSNSNNMFMVGDVKQSIYGFRMAKPEIFVNKCDVYKEDSSKGVLINLKKNFRSRKEVLDAVNDVFFSVMTKETSGIEYDDDAKLYFGADAVYGDDKKNDVEILIADADYGKDTEIEEESDGEEADSDAYETSRKVEAAVVASRIRELIDNHYQITDKDNEDNIISRDIRYSDIAIILRGANTNGREYEETLLDYNIPCIAPNSKGYFNTVEVKRVLAFLSVIDNPCKDIELAAILHSPIFDISNDMLAKIRIFSENHKEKRKEYKGKYLYYAIEDYIKNVELDGDCQDKEYDRLVYAMDMINELRTLVHDTPIHKLLEIIYERTSYLDYVSSLLNGQYKRANLLALIDRALDYEKTRFKGVFRFLKYIDAMDEYNLDLGEASISSENDNVVKILTMHKSKGLEYPVVFVSDLGNRITCQDLNKSTLIHNTLGIGMEIRKDVNSNKFKKDSQYKINVKKALKKDYMAEEARLLYVAMTRAKEKLILTGAIHKPYETINTISNGKMNYNRMLNASCRLEWIIRGIASSNKASLDSMIKFVEPDDKVISDAVEFINIADKKEELNTLVSKFPSELSDKIKDRISFEYPYVINNNIKAKYSVSEIKHNAIEQAFEKDSDENATENMYVKPEFLDEKKKSIIPEFISKKAVMEVNKGALYGTAMHRVLECYDFLSNDYSSTLESQLNSMKMSNLVTEEQYSLVNVDKLQVFVQSDVASRMHIAMCDDKLWIEQPFVLQEMPKNLFKDVSDELEPIIVQGIIDVFFIEDDEIVLLDYKTDNVKSEKELADRYKAQIDLYAKALEQVFQKNVKEKILYSFSLEKTIVIE